MPLDLDAIADGGEGFGTIALQSRESAQVLVVYSRQRRGARTAKAVWWLERGGAYLTLHEETEIHGDRRIPKLWQ